MQSYYKRGGDMMILTLQVMRYFADIFETMHSDKQVFFNSDRKGNKCHCTAIIVPTNGLALLGAEISSMVKVP